MAWRRMKNAKGERNFYVNKIVYWGTSRYQNDDNFSRNQWKFIDFGTFIVIKKSLLKKALKKLSVNF